MSKNILIKGGMVIDGTGNPAIRADVLVEGDHIVDVGQFPNADSERVIDAGGLAVAPGFIDAHTHLDFFLPSPRHAEVLKTWAYQGVTTIVAGNCGYSPAPINHAYKQDISTYWNFAHPHDGLAYEWTTMGEYLDYLERNGQAFNAAILTGYNVLRTNAMGGFHARLATQTEINEMKKMLKESLEAGSIGMSLGLFYCPGIFSNTDELVDLASVMTDFGAPLVPHTRGLTVTYDKAVEEVIKIAETNRIPLHLSHHAGGGGDIRTRALKTINEAMDRGLEIAHDNIPFACGPTTVLALLPPWLFDGGVEKGLEQLGDPGIRNRAVDELKSHVPTWPTWEHKWWTDKFLSFSSLYNGFRKEENLRFERMPMKEIARELDKDPYDALFDLLMEEEGKLFMLGGFFEDFDDPMGDDFIAHLLADSNCAIMSDIIGADFNHGNPVACGAFTKVLGYFARDRGVMTQEEAVRRMTSLPAKQMGLKDRGEIRKGAYADITIFNPGTVSNKATFADPYQLSEGIDHVLINGQVILEKGQYHKDALAGKVIRR